MTVTTETYDDRITGMRHQTVAALSWETQHGLAGVPIVQLPDDASWIHGLTADDLAGMRADWRFLIPPKPTAQRPALVRFDLLFPDRRRLAVLWTVLDDEDFGVLSLAELADRIVFRVSTDEPGIAVSDLGLFAHEDFRDLAVLVRDPALTRAVAEYVEQRRQWELRQSQS